MRKRSSLPGAARVRAARWLGLLSSVLALSGEVAAQQSASFSVTEHVFNSGGSPGKGIIEVCSASHDITVDAVGDSLVVEGMSSPSYLMEAGSVVAHAPPGEVTNLRFASRTTLAWDPEGSGGPYNVYRGSLLDILAFGSCLESGVAVETVTDTFTPSRGAGLFYLVTAENRLGEEGTKGYSINGSERPNAAPCP